MFVHKAGQCKAKLLTDETVYFLGVAGIVRDGKAAITNSHLAITKRKGEEAKLI